MAPGLEIEPDILGPATSPRTGEAFRSPGFDRSLIANC